MAASELISTYEPFLLEMLRNYGYSYQNIILKPIYKQFYNALDQSFGSSVMSGNLFESVPSSIIVPETLVTSLASKKDYYFGDLEVRVTGKTVVNAGNYEFYLRSQINSFANPNLCEVHDLIRLGTLGFADNKRFEGLLFNKITVDYLKVLDANLVSVAGHFTGFKLTWN